MSTDSNDIKKSFMGAIANAQLVIFLAKAQGLWFTTLVEHGVSPQYAAVLVNETVASVMKETAVATKGIIEAVGKVLETPAIEAIVQHLISEDPQ